MKAPLRTRRSSLATTSVPCTSCAWAMASASLGQVGRLSHTGSMYSATTSPSFMRANAATAARWASKSAARSSCRFAFNQQ